MIKLQSLAFCGLVLALVGQTAASEKTLKKCLKESPGATMASCYFEENRVLRRQQRELLSKIRTELTVCKIHWMGYYPDQALKELKLSQQSWEQFVKHDCEYRTLTFGQGTAASPDHEYCHMRHLKERNKRLSEALEHAREVRNMLLDWEREQEAGFIRCPTK